MTLVEFLMQRIAEDERAARKLEVTDRRPVLSLASTVNHPRRILAECEAKRRIVALHDLSHDPCDAHDASFRSIPCETMEALALPYADHEDYLAGVEVMNGQADHGASSGCTGQGGYVCPPDGPTGPFKVWCSSCELTIKANDLRLMNDAMREHMVERHNLRPLT